MSMKARSRAQSLPLGLLGYVANRQRTACPNDLVPGPMNVYKRGIQYRPGIRDVIFYSSLGIHHV